MADAFPTTLADLSFRDDTISSQHLYRSLRDLRKATLSIPNRLRSIVHDAGFVQQVADEQSSNGSRLPLIANERCGSWYIPPDRKAGSAYFKSTDGHFGQWDCSLRRLNLQVLRIVGTHGGAVLVDSTRRGKSMPDALAKTVPIWVAVMNRLLFPHVPTNHAFQRPPAPYRLGDSEVCQIEARLQGFARAVAGLGLDVDKLRREAGKPMKVFWRVNDPTGSKGTLQCDVQSDGALTDHHPLILCSASRRVWGAEMSKGSYIQGAGDDSEGWARGLTPALFWQHQDELFNTPESELESVISRLLLSAGQAGKRSVAVRIAPTSNLYIAKAAMGESSVLDPVEQNTKTSSVESQTDGAARPEMGADTVPGTEFDLVINCNRIDSSIRAGIRLDLGCRMGKLGSKDLGKKFDVVRAAAHIRLKRDPAASILVTCETGRDLCIGVALALLCLCYDEGGRVMVTPDPHVPSEIGVDGEQGRFTATDAVDKSFVRRRLAWVMSSNPDASPSRATLQAVHAFLIERPG